VNKAERGEKWNDILFYLRKVTEELPLLVSCMNTTLRLALELFNDATEAEKK